MRSLRGNDQSVVRVLNRNAIFNTLHREGPLSRAQLKTRSGLSGAAITGVVADLLQLGLVEETAAGPSTGGRPPVMLTVNYKARTAVGVKLMEHQLQAVLTDFGGEVQHHRRRELPSTRPADVVRAVRAVVETLLDETHTPRARLAGLGVGLPGVIDAGRGVCVQSSYLGWRDVPLARLLEDVLGVPVTIDNDVNAFAAAERLFGHGKGAAHLAVITLGRGIGAGLVVNGQPLRGRDGGAGEFGHLVSEPGGRPCECGKRGCLEAYASEGALLARAREAAPDLDLPDVGALLARRDDPRVAGLLRDAGARVGVGLANLVNLLNPELIVVGGEGVRLGEPFLSALREALFANTFDGLGTDLPVIVEPWGDDAWARGAASLAISRTFDLNLEASACTSAD